MPLALLKEQFPMLSITSFVQVNAPSSVCRTQDRSGSLEVSHRCLRDQSFVVNMRLSQKGILNKMKIEKKRRNVR